MHPITLYHDMALIRHFEQRVLALFDAGELAGTTHCAIGQEANAVAIAAALQHRDVIVSPHRCHGHYLARTGRPDLLLAELMGRQGGVCDGRGGSQHLVTPSFISNGVLGGTIANAVGMALAEQRLGTGAIVVAFTGDGALGEGIVWEAFNFAALSAAPLLVVLENNRWAQSTPLAAHFAGDILLRARGFGLEARACEAYEPLALLEHAASAVAYVRTHHQPLLLVIDCDRLCDHSRRDDLRPTHALEAAWARDPLASLAATLPAEELERVHEELHRRLDAAERWARSQPLASLEGERP